MIEMVHHLTGPMVRMSLMMIQTGQIRICFQNMFQLSPNWNIYCMSMR